MFLTKLKGALAMVLAAAVVTTGSWGVFRAPAPAQESQPPAVEAPEPPAAQPQPANSEPDSEIWAQEVKLRGHKRPVQCVVFSPDGKTLASGSGWLRNPPPDNRGELWLWDVATGKLRMTLDTERAVRSLAFSPDGRLLAAAELDKTAKLRDPETGKVVVTLRPPEPGVARVAFSPDGRLLATANANRTIQLWSVAGRDEERPVRTLAGHDAVQAIAFSPDGQRLADGGKDGLWLWEVASGKEIAAMHKDSVESVAFSPDGKVLVSAGADGAVRLWDVATGKEVRRFAASKLPVLCVAFAPDGRTLVASIGQPEGGVVVWDAATGRIKAKLYGQEHSVFAVAFSPDGKRLVSASDNGTIIIWRREVQPAARVLRGPTPRADGLVADRIDQLLSQLLRSNRPDDQVVEALYLATLGRLPTDGEKRNCARLLSEKPDARQEAFERLLAALTASTECQAHLEALQKRTSRGPKP